MQFGGRYTIAAGRDAVWAALNDADVLGRAIPGCSHIAWTGPTTLDLAITVPLGPLRPTFKGGLELSSIVPAERYTLTGRGKGGLLGLAEGSSDITLADAANGETELAFLARAGASGQIMKLGRAIIGNSAQAVIDGFFVRFGDAMGAVVIPLGAPDAAG
jgi:carbon monoxide dehydrogenase subunit G